MCDWSSYLKCPGTGVCSETLFRTSAVSGMLGYRGGHVEPGETPYDALDREIAEETGWRLTGVVAILGEFDFRAADQKARRELDLLVEVEGDLDSPQIEWSKYSEFRWISLDEIEILKENRSPDDTLIYEVVKKALESKEK